MAIAMADVLMCQCLKVLVFECVNGAVVSLFQVAEVPMKSYDYTVPEF